MFIQQKLEQKKLPVETENYNEKNYVGDDGTFVVPVEEVKEEEIEETKEWSDLECECATNHCASIKFIDRVFYTRVECYDGNDKLMGVTHIALLKGLPATISSKLYPVGQAEYVLQ